MKTYEPLTLKKNIVWNGIGSIFYQGTLWVTTVLVVILSANYENSGILAFAMTAGNIIGAIAVYNARTFQISDINNQYTAQNYVAFRCITILLALCGTVIYLIFIVHKPDLILPIAVFALFKSDESFAIVLYGVDQKAYRMDFIGISQLIRGAAILIFFTAGLLVGKSLILALLLMFLACVCVTFFYDIPHSGKLEMLYPQITTQQAKALFVACTPAVLSAVFCGLVVTVSRQYFGLIFGNEALGLYAAVATPSVLIQLLAQYLYSPVLGPIAEEWTKQNRKSLSTLLLKIFVGMLVLIVIATCILSIAGDKLLVSVFGEDIAGYTYLFPGVLICAGLIALIWFCSDVLITFRKTKYALLANIVNLIVAIITVVPLTEQYYMAGLNYTIILANFVAVIMALIMIGFFVRHCGLNA